MTLTEKRRILATDSLSHINWLRDVRVSGYQQWYAENITVYSHQITRSEAHAWPEGRGKWDAGGPFDTIKLEYKRPSKGTYEILRYPSTYQEEYRRSSWVPWSVGFDAPFVTEKPTFEQCAEWVSPSSGRTNLTPLGTKFISQTIPTNPVADVGVSLAELYREGLPSMIGAALDIRSKLAFFKSLGPEYLNVEFGWKPLVSGFMDAAKAISDSEKILTNLAKHSGKDLRRHRLLPEVRNVDNSTITLGVNPTWLPGSWISPAPRYSVTTETVRQQSFSGCYVYHYDPGQMSEISRIATQARLLYGIQLTPDILWNLTPWSWLADWFANVGPLLSNVSAFQSDGLVLKYGYVMEEISKTVRRSTDANVFIGSHPRTVADEFRGTWKRRQQATPYGFGLNSIDFTSRQWAILGALGLTLAPQLGK